MTKKTARQNARKRLIQRALALGAAAPAFIGAACSVNDPIPQSKVQVPGDDLQTASCCEMYMNNGACASWWPDCDQSIPAAGGPRCFTVPTDKMQPTPSFAANPPTAACLCNGDYWYAWQYWAFTDSVGSHFCRGRND